MYAVDGAPPLITLKAGAATDVGRVRDVNEDRYLVADGIFAVCDGLGGHQAGEVASDTAVHTLETAFTEPAVDRLIEAVEAANRAIWQLAQDQPDKRGMGTTITAVAVVEQEGEDQLALVNVGDSRGYLLRDSELTQLTEDHSLVAEMERDGRLTHEEARVHPQRAVITRALGLEPDVEIDHLELLPYRGDRLLLCSDGLTNEVADDQIGSILRRLADPTEAAKDLVTQARANGGNDNITAVVIDVTDDDGRAEEASAALAGSGSGTGEHTAVIDDTRRARRERAQLARRERRAAEPRPRRVTWRVVLFLLLFVGVLTSAGAAVNWYARHTFYVGLQGSQVVIFRGRPGGLLWFQPTLEKRTTLSTDEVVEARLPDLRKGKPQSSLADADRYVNNLEQEAKAAQAARTPTTTSTTTTTARGSP
jgi:serine/threonine protein phosphatase PrpC